MGVKTGVQQYMVRDFMEEEQQVTSVFGTIRKIGYDGIELCGFLMKEGIDWKAMVDEAGLIVPAMHQIGEDMFADPDKFIAEANAFECKYLVAAAAIKTDFDDKDSVMELTSELNKLGKVFREAGIQLLYHNHNAELAKVDNATTALQIIVEETDSDAVKFEFDSFWTAKSGAYPVEWMEKMKGRMPFYHVNDAGVPKDDIGKPIRDIMEGRELGRGVMNIPRFVETAKAAGCETIILETHDNWIDGDPVKSMEISYGYLSELIG